MKIVHVRLANMVRWNISVSDPKSVNLRFLNGARLLNPLLFINEDPTLAVLPMKGGWHVIANGLSFAVSDDIEPGLDFANEVLPFLNSLRHLTKQAAFSTDVVGISTYRIGRLPKLEIPPRKSGKHFLFGAFRLKTALTLNALKSLAKQKSLPEFSLYDELFLDALYAHEKNDHRLTILQAAIAVESLARTKLDREYVRILDGQVHASHMNIVAFPIPGGEFKKKDPIYSLLIEGDQFSRLLHEMPLYLLRRSLMNENHALFTACLQLYRTRNRLSHGKAIVSSDNSLFQLNRDGSLQALQAAIGVYNWFGEGGYQLPDLERVELRV